MTRRSARGMQANPVDRIEVDSTLLSGCFRDGAKFD